MNAAVVGTRKSANVWLTSQHGSVLFDLCSRWQRLILLGGVFDRFLLLNEGVLRGGQKGVHGSPRSPKRVTDRKSEVKVQSLLYLVPFL